MTIICAWCGKDMGEKDGQGQEGTTHGICQECMEKQLHVFEPVSLPLPAREDAK